MLKPGELSAQIGTSVHIIVRPMTGLDPADRADRQIQSKRAVANSWRVYDAGGGAGLYLRDSLNPVNHAKFGPAQGSLARPRSPAA